MMKRPPAHNSVHSSQSMKLHSKSSLNMTHLVSPNDSRLLVNSMNHNDPVKQCRRRLPLEAIPTISSHHNIIISNSEDPIRSNVTKQPPPPASNNKTYTFFSASIRKDLEGGEQLRRPPSLTKGVS